MTNIILKIYDHLFLHPITDFPIATVLDESHVQDSIVYAKINGLQIRMPSGGHDCETL